MDLYLDDFEYIYQNTYNKVLRYIICNCSNIEDVNDLIQETYFEFYKILKRKKCIKLDNYFNYIIGIAKKRIQRFYGKSYKNNEQLLKVALEYDNYELNLTSSVDLEDEINNKLDAEKIMNYIMKKSDIVIKIFYLYYYDELKISQIAIELNITESNVKNILYRTINSIKNSLKEGDLHD